MTDANLHSATTSGLNAKFANRTALVGVIGMGYVGLPTMVAIGKSGFKVTGIDTDVKRVEQINRGSSYVDDVPDNILSPLCESGMIRATAQYDVIQDLDVILVCVPTPITRYKEPNLGPINNSLSAMANHIKGDQLIILQSTSFPGTTEEVALPKLQHIGREVGKDFYLAFALERVDPGNNDFSVQNVPKVVGGVTSECTQLASSFLSTFIDRVVSVSSPKVAEMSKLLENTFRSVNIALVNELAILCRRMDIDIWEVIEAASTKPFGYMPFFPGPGVGGHCIPVDPFYLSWKAKEHEFYVNFIQLAAEVNDNMPYYTLSRIVDALGEHKKPLNGSRILALGVTFKEDINDTRNSPALRVIELLHEKGAFVDYNDDYVQNLEVNGSSLKSVNLEPNLYSQFDAVAILVNHSYYDLTKIVENSKLVIDPRHATGALGHHNNVVKL